MIKKLGNWTQKSELTWTFWGLVVYYRDKALLLNSPLQILITWISCTFPFHLLGPSSFLIRQAIYMNFVEYLPNNPIILNQKWLNSFNFEIIYHCVKFRRDDLKAFQVSFNNPKEVNVTVKNAISRHFLYAWNDNSVINVSWMF